MKIRMTYIWMVVIASVFAVAHIAAACELHARSAGKMLVGDARTLGNGTAKSWVMVDAAGTPMAIGVTFNAAALTGLPGEFAEHVVPLPANAPATGFNHISVDWEPRGHIPVGIYDKPHFDFHFYMISEAERDKITGVGDDAARIAKAVSPEYAPPGYIAAPDSGMPRMGWHWVATDSPELHGGTFTSTLLYGYYDGSMVFVEPMVTTAFLQTKPNLTEQISLPAKYPRRGYYPTYYTVSYDEAHNEYTVALGGLTLR